MTIEQCYEQLHGDYAQVIQRLPSPALVERFIGKFLDDGSFSELTSAMAVGQTEAAFRAAHTLKGVSANLGFEQLRQSASTLTEFLRGKAEPVPAEALPLLEQVRRDYQMTVDAIRAYRAERF